jgi:two-component system alkaline phosphatase synthesis response regulator PhoP
MRSVLVVEDNAEMRILVEAALDDYQLAFGSTLKDAKEALRTNKFDLILLDLGLPDGDGLKFLAELSGQPESKDVPVIILSGKSETVNKVMAFSIGAEDFIAKPFDPLELKARVASKLRKSEKQQQLSEVLRAGDLKIDVLKQKVWIQNGQDSEPVDLTTLEFKLLLNFARAPERVFTREYLLNEVWGMNVSVTDRTVDTHIGHLRKKLAHSKSKIETVIGSGYRFLNPSA